MENKIKNIIREVPAEQAELSFYFDGDCYNENSGDYNNTVFIVCCDRGHRYGLNIEEYNRIVERAEGIAEGFYDVEHKKSAWTSYETYKDVMKDWGIDYTSHKCHLLKEWYGGDVGDVDDADSIAQFLTITTGKTWDTTSVHGYCQGDYCEIVYCKQYYPENVRKYGQIWLGCAKEFCVITLDENGQEDENEPACYGFIVADCEARTDADYKRIVCEWEGLNPEETELQMIDGYHTYTKYDYRTA